MELRRVLHQQPVAANAPRHGHDRGPCLLTKTIVNSSVTKAILPARIRGKKKNDVLFIHDDHIELKQLVSQRLRTVALKTDLDSTIAAARLIGRFDHRENSPESDNSLNDGSFMDIDSEQEFTLPPNILVLVIQCWREEKLMFMFAKDEPHGEVSFITSTFPLPGAEEPAERLGAHLAVDPRSDQVFLSWQQIG